MVVKGLYVGGLADCDHKKTKQYKEGANHPEHAPAPLVESPGSYAPSQGKHGQPKRQDRRPPAIDHHRINDERITATCSCGGHMVTLSPLDPTDRSICRWPARGVLPAG